MKTISGITTFTNEDMRVNLGRAMSRGMTVSIDLGAEYWWIQARRKIKESECKNELSALVTVRSFRAISATGSTGLNVVARVVALAVMTQLPLIDVPRSNPQFQSRKRAHKVKRNYNTPGWYDLRSAIISERGSTVHHNYYDPFKHLSERLPDHAYAVLCKLCHEKKDEQLRGDGARTVRAWLSMFTSPHRTRRVSKVLFDHFPVQKDVKSCRTAISGKTLSSRKP
jgi:hypothetical protein